MGDERRVVVTGMDLRTPFGNLDETWDALLDGRSSVRRIEGQHERFGELNSQIASYFDDEMLNAEVLGLNNDSGFRRSCRYLKLSSSAATALIERSGILDDEESRHNTGVCISGGLGGAGDLERAGFHVYNLEKRMNRMKPSLASIVPASAASSMIVSRYGFHSGVAPSIEATCTSGLLSITYGFDKIMAGRADNYVVGGTGELSIASFAGFDNLGALSTRNEYPFEASRPFDISRDGFVFGEGAGVLLLEELSTVKDKSRILAEIKGYGERSDASKDPLKPNPDGKYLIEAMRDAIEDAEVNSEDIDYINAHGTSTPLNDGIESRAIRKVFGSHADRLSVNAFKSYVGHTLGASGSIELILGIKAMNEGIIPPVLNLEKPDLEGGCDLNYVIGSPREIKINNFIKNSAGFWGKNLSMVVGRYKDD